MTLEKKIKLRLQFLNRVVQRECVQLNRTTKRLFVESFTLEKAEKLSVITLRPVKNKLPIFLLHQSRWTGFFSRIYSGRQQNTVY